MTNTPPKSGRSTPSDFIAERSSLLGSDQATERPPDDQTDRASGSDFVDYGTNNRTYQTLPTRLARSASVARKLDRKEKRKAKWQQLKTKARYYIPVVAWLPDYSVRAFIGDLTAAVTMTSLLTPQSISYSTNLAHSDPISGLLGASIPAIVYSVLGTCRQLSVGPEAALSLIMGELIAKFIEDEQHAHGALTASQKLKLTMSVTTIVTFEAGLITFVLGLFRLGFLDAVLSRALLRGFISAVGVVIFVSQLIPILGLEHLLSKSPATETTLDKLVFVFENLHHTHRLTLWVSLAALSVLILAKMFKAKLAARRGFRWLAYIPEVLVVVVASTVLSAVYDWKSQGLQVLGKAATGAVRIELPFTHLRTGYMSKCIGTATVIAILGFLDSIVGAKDSAARYDYPISPNRELVAIGSANLVASLVSGALPGYGSITRSRLAGATGATTQMASLLTGALVLLVTFFLLGFLAALPKCLLAVVIVVVVWSILEEAPHDVKFFWKLRAWVDCALMALTFLLSLFVNVETGITVSIALSLVLCVKHSASMRIKILGRVPGTQFFEPLDDDDDDDGLLPSEEIPGILIVRLRDVSLTFANAGALKERLRRLERYGKGHHHPSDQPRRAEASVIIFDLVDVEDIDASALQLILELVEAYVARHVVIYWTQIPPASLARLRKAGVIKACGGEAHVQPNVSMALQVLNDTILSHQSF